MKRFSLKVTLLESEVSVGVVEIRKVQEIPAHLARPAFPGFGALLELRVVAQLRFREVLELALRLHLVLGAAGEFQALQK